jgi:mRNA interferase RelE/StbE
MDSYRIAWKHSAIKELKYLPKEALVRIVQAVENLAENPFPAGVKKLVGSEHTYRIREGSYRVIFTVTPSSLVIEIIRVGHRKNVYSR